MTDEFDLDRKLPCPVRLPPSTQIGKGCTIRTLLQAIFVSYRADQSFIESADKAQMRPTEGQTPRTDTAVIVSDGADGWGQVVRADFARQLERELATAEARAYEMMQLLQRIRQWDMMDTAADGKYWRREIDKALSPAPVETVPTDKERT